jgi:putative tricarboxylic transport membrane protein
MVDLATILAGLGDAFTLTNILFVLSGVILGQFVGAMPGSSQEMTIAIAIPFTLVVAPLSAIGFLIGVNKGGLFGGSIPAILINMPGTPDTSFILK